MLKDYLKKRNALGAFNGGISSFLLIYMTLVYFQNSNGKTDLVGFLEFYANMDEKTQGWAIDLSELKPLEYSTKLST